MLLKLDILSNKYTTYEKKYQHNCMLVSFGSNCVFFLIFIFRNYKT